MLVDDGLRDSATELNVDVFDPNASVYVSEMVNETISDAVDDTVPSQWSISDGLHTAKRRSSSMDIEIEHGGEVNRAVGPLRALLANKEFVTQPQLSSLLRQAGFSTQDNAVEVMVLEMQQMGFLGPLTRGKGTL